MNITLAADLIVAFLLVFTIYYAAKLSHRLSVLRADKAALQTLVQSLMQASVSAEAGVKGLKATAEEMSRELQRKLQDAQALRDDLAYMIDRGGTVADRMEVSLRRREPPKPEVARPPEPRPAPEAARREPKLGGSNLIREMAARLAPRAAGPGEAEAEAPSRAERDLLRALAGRR